MKKNDSEKKLSKHVYFRLDSTSVKSVNGSGKIPAIRRRIARRKFCVWKIKKKSRTGNGRLQQSTFDSAVIFGTTNRYVIFDCRCFSHALRVLETVVISLVTWHNIIYERFNYWKNLISFFFFWCRRNKADGQRFSRYITELIALVSALALAPVSHTNSHLTKIKNT